MILNFIFCFIATAFFALIINCPKKAIGCASLIASVCYILFLFVCENENIVFAYFSSAFLLAALSEIAARIFKMPSTVFLSPAIIPLVPGMGIYETMINLINFDFETAGIIGSQTIVYLSTIAVAIAIVLVLVSAINSLIKSSAR